MQRGPASSIVLHMEAALTLEQAEGILKEGRPLVFPTDTVWGIGIAVAFCEGPQVLSEAKRRPPDKPVAWLVGSSGALDAYGAGVPAYARELAKTFWPGGLTLVVKAGPSVPEAFRSRKGAIGMRMPDSQGALSLVEAAGCPLATTSANFSGAPAPRVGEEVDPEFLKASGACVFRFSQGCARGGCASSVVDCTGRVPELLRAGTISASEIEAACGLPLSRKGGAGPDGAAC